MGDVRDQCFRRSRDRINQKELLGSILEAHFKGIKIKPIAKYEDEDFTFEVIIPKNLPIDQVEETCHMECIKTEDEYDFFILPKVVYEK